MTKIYTQREREFFAKHGRLPDTDDRADSVGKDGLVMTEKLNDAGGKIRTFAYPTPDHPKTWMDPHRQPLQRGFLNKDQHDKKRFGAIVKQRLADEQAVQQTIAKRGIDALQTQSIAHALAEAGDAAYSLFGGR